MCVTNTDRVGDQVRNIHRAGGVASTVCVVSSTGVHETLQSLRRMAPCFGTLTRGVNRLFRCVPRAGGQCFDISVPRGRPREARKVLLVATSGKLTNTCGRRTVHMYRRCVSERPRAAMFVVNRCNERCFLGGGVPFIRSFRCSTMRPGLASTEGVYTRLLRCCSGGGLSRVYVVCASCVNSGPNRYGGVALLPLVRAGFCINSTSVLRVRGRFLPDPSIMLSKVMPDCLVNFVCNYLIRDFYDRRRTQVATVGDTNSGTRSVLGVLQLRCGGVERATVAGRVVRVATNMETLGHHHGSTLKSVYRRSR